MVVDDERELTGSLAEIFKDHPWRLRRAPGIFHQSPRFPMGLGAIPGEGAGSVKPGRFGRTVSHRRRFFPVSRESRKSTEAKKGYF
jgi:hypothetical protein